MTDWPFSAEVAERIHAAVLTASGGAPGIRDHGLLESALARPLASFGGQRLYPTPVEKAAALAHGVVKNHPFIDGNKRTATVLMITLLRFNGLDLVAGDGNVEEVIVSLAEGQIDLKTFTSWLEANVR